MGQYKELPYGESRFERFIEDNLFCVDKTCFITELERRARHFFLICSRRFGKSLFLSMLESYYDIDRKDRVDELLKNLWLGAYPTVSRNRFLVLRFDFSQVTGPIVHSYESLTFDAFIDKYRCFFSESFLKRYASLLTLDASYRFSALSVECASLGLKSHLIIDQYDNFTNDVLRQYGEGLYHALAHAEGLKGGTVRISRIDGKKTFRKTLRPNGQKYRGMHA